MGLALVVCERVIIEQGTGNKTLVGVFNAITSPVFPAVHPFLSIYLSLTNGSGSKNVELRLVRGAGVVIAASSTVEFDTPNAVVEIIYRFRNVAFLEPGMHSFEVYADEELIFESRFQLVRLTTP